MAKRGSVEVRARGSHTTTSGTSRAYEFDATDLSEIFPPVEQLSSGVDAVEVLYLDGNIRIERGLGGGDDQGPLFVFVSDEAQLVTRRK